MTVKVQKKNLPDAVKYFTIENDDILTVVINKRGCKHETSSNIYKGINTGAS